MVTGGGTRRAGSGAAGKSVSAGRTPAPSLSVARVAVDVSLAHLDRAFDYLVPADDDERVVGGCRVRVRFAGQLVDGFVLERVDASAHEGKLAYLDRVVSPEPVLTAEVARLARAVADRWAGTLADVLRLAVPPRHATAERSAGRRGDAPPASAGRDVAVVRQVVVAPPGDWPAAVAERVAATVGAGRGAVVVVPDARDVARVDAALAVALGTGAHVALTADLGPAERYRRFLALARGDVRAVVGTRAAGYAPVHDLGLVVVWDDGDDLLAEPRAPYAHARDVAVLRAHLAGASCVLAGHAVTPEAAHLVATGWAEAVGLDRDTRRSTVPRIRATGDDADLARDPAARAARLPTVAWEAAREALAADRPVLVQVPRRGYQPSLACATCRTPARCSRCAGPLARRGDTAPLACRWCGVVAADWHCPACGGDRIRAVVVGARRTAEELGRAFPGTPVRTSGGTAVLATVPAGRAVVVATPGAEPVADGGYAAALLLDGWALLGRDDARAGEEALRRWLNAAALVTGGQHARVVVVAPAELPPVQALVRWDPLGYARREHDEREALHLPPAATVAALTGPAAAVDELLSLTDLPPVAELLGPVPAPAQRRADEDAAGDAERVLVRVPRRLRAELAQALKDAAAVRSARKADGAVRVEIDPAQLL